MIGDPTDLDVLVVGGGPTGLTVAVQAVLMGARVRIVERRTHPCAWAPALAVHARTLEVLRGLGVADELLTRGVSEVELRVHVGRSVVGGRLHHLRLPETQYPFVFFVPQPEVEAVLRDRLSQLGIDVEWGSECVGIEQDPSQVRSLLRLADGREEVISSRYVAGCDGRASSVRGALGVSFRGRRYRQSILVANVVSDDLAADTAHAFVAANGILSFFPLPSGRWRLIAPHPADPGQLDPRDLVDEYTSGRIRLGAVDWMKEMTLHHRLADHYRLGRVFLAGDAAHTHSPAGAQGMNTGIQDGVNLGWKLALSARGACEELLDTYQTERRRVARHVITLTGLAYALEISDRAWVKWMRVLVGGLAARIFLSTPRLISIAARLASGLDTSYRRGAFATPVIRTSGTRPGRRLRDSLIAGGGVQRVHEVIDGSAFHLIAFDEDSLRQIGERIGGYSGVLTTHSIGRSMLVGSRSFPAFVLVRPDGYIATSGDVTDGARVIAYLDRWVGRSLVSDAAEPI